LWAKKKPGTQGKEAARVWAKRKPGSHITYSQEMEFQWTFEISKSDFRGQNSMDCGVLYIIGNILERKCLK
jgi:hypothetical protein